MDNDLRLLIDTADVSRNEMMLKGAIDSFASACGFEWFAYLHTAGAEIRTFNSYPENWQTAYLKNRYCRVDPVVTEAKRRMDLFCWSALEWPAYGGSELRRFRDDAMDRGIRSGVTVPVKGSFGSTIMLTFASSATSTDPSKLQDRRELMRMVLAIHYRLKIIGTAKAEVFEELLSPREMVCLAWAARGKTAAETSLLVGISERTVQHYLDKARGKLDAANIPHLVAIAKDHGLA